MFIIESSYYLEYSNIQQKVEKMFQSALWCTQHPKAGRNTQQLWSQLFEIMYVILMWAFSLPPPPDLLSCSTMVYTIRILIMHLSGIQMAESNREHSYRANTILTMDFNSPVFRPWTEYQIAIWISDVWIKSIQMVSLFECPLFSSPTVPQRFSNFKPFFIATFFTLT